MNTATKTILVLTLAAAALVVLFLGGGLTTRELLDAGASGTSMRGSVGLGEFNGYLTVLMLVDVGLGTVVAWMLFGKQE